jgi:hypothetical protein
VTGATVGGTAVVISEPAAAVVTATVFGADDNGIAWG